jgi:predicted 2-oxoglutarate/Fe(II)-dependent dioxygenase YbiX
VTTTAVGELMTPEDLAETLEILVQASELQERDLVQAVWSVVSHNQRSQLLQTMTQEVRQQVLACLNWNPECVDRSQGYIEGETRTLWEEAA